MSHGLIALLDSQLRSCWFHQPKFALSNALYRASSLRVYQQTRGNIGPQWEN